MKDIIKSKDVTETAVIVLMDGKKTNVVSMKENGEFECKTSSLITQYLNPNNCRDIMTNKISKALYSAFQFYMKEMDSKAGEKEKYAKVLLFVQAISGFDLTNIFGTELTDKVSLAVKTIFDAFVGKSKVHETELENIMYLNLIGEFGKVGTDAISIPVAEYFNFTDFYKSEDDGDSYEMSIAEFEDNMEYIIALMNAESIEEFKQEHGTVLYILTKREISGSNWKEEYLLNKYRMTGFEEILKSVVKTIKINNQYLTENSRMQSFRKRLNDAIEKNNIKEGDQILRIQRLLESYTNIIQLQARVNKSFTTFGAEYDYRKEITDTRELIKNMMDFLFNGVYAKVGVKDKKGFLKEAYRDYLSRYISGQQESFTEIVKGYLFDRIMYNLEKNEYFEAVLWQYMYYIFGIDFYMLRSCDAEKWGLLIDILLEDVVNNFNISDIRKHIQLLYDKEQYSECKDTMLKFTPDEVKWFREFDMHGWKRYSNVFENVIHFDNGSKVAQLKHETAMKYLTLQMNSLINKLRRTIDFIVVLYCSDSPEIVLNYYKSKNINLIYVYDCDHEGNWKCRMLYNMYINGHSKLVICKDELNQLIEIYSALFMGQKMNEIDFESHKNEIKKLIKEITYTRLHHYNRMNRHGSSQCENEKKDGLNELNNTFLYCDLVESVYKTLKIMFGYRVYSEWVSGNVEIIKN